jgi:hypothetical protein
VKFVNFTGSFRDKDISILEDMDLNYSKDISKILIGKIFLLFHMKASMLFIVNDHNFVHTLFDSLITTFTIT